MFQYSNTMDRPKAFINFTHATHIGRFLYCGKNWTRVQATFEQFHKPMFYNWNPTSSRKNRRPITDFVLCGNRTGYKINGSSLTSEKKINKYLRHVQEIKNKKKVTLHELQSIIGSLNHCCYIIPAGRAFLRRLIDLTIGITDPHHHIRLIFWACVR